MMLVSLEHDIAFLAIPKTGTTAIEMALRKEAELILRTSPTMKHMNVMTFEKFFRPYLKSIGAGGVRTLCVMRHPVAQLESWYFYRRRIGDGGADRLKKSSRDVSWPEFVEAYLSDNPPDYAKIGLQSRFMGAAETGVPLVNMIFPYERMEDLVAYLEGKLGHKIELEERNVSVREKASLPPELMDRLTTALATDIALHQRVLNKEFYPTDVAADKKSGTARGKQDKKKDLSEPL